MAADSAPNDELGELRNKVAKLTEINRALMQRVEHGLDLHGNAYHLFQAAILLGPHGEGPHARAGAGPGSGRDLQPRAERGGGRQHDDPEPPAGRHRQHLRRVRDLRSGRPADPVQPALHRFLARPRCRDAHRPHLPGPHPHRIRARLHRDAGWAERRCLDRRPHAPARKHPPPRCRPLGLRAIQRPLGPGQRPALDRRRSGLDLHRHHRRQGRGTPGARARLGRALAASAGDAGKHVDRRRGVRQGPAPGDRQPPVWRAAQPARHLAHARCRAAQLPALQRSARRAGARHRLAHHHHPRRRRRRKCR